MKFFSIYSLIFLAIVNSEQAEAITETSMSKFICADVSRFISTDVFQFYSQNGQLELSGYPVTSCDEFSNNGKVAHIKMKFDNAVTGGRAVYGFGLDIHFKVDLENQKCLIWRHNSWLEGSFVDGSYRPPPPSVQCENLGDTDNTYCNLETRFWDQIKDTCSEAVYYF